MMGLGVRVVELRLMSDMQTLVYDDKANASKPTNISLADITKIKVPSSTSFELKTSEKSYEFEADSSTTQKNWVEALKLTVASVQRPSLKDTIHRERRERVERKYKDEDIVNRQRQTEASKSSREAKRAEIKNKYGH